MDAKSDTIFISKNKAYHIENELLIKKDQVLYAEPGALITLSDTAKIIAFGSIIFRGSEQEKVQVNGKFNNAGRSQIVVFHKADSLSFLFTEVSDVYIKTINCSVSFRNSKFKNSKNLNWNEAISNHHGGFIELDSCFYISNNTGEGLLCHNIKYPDIKNSRFLKVPDAIEFIQCKNGVIKNNVIKNGGDDAIDLNGCYNIHILNNLIENYEDRGMEIGCTDLSVSTDILIQGNTITKTHTGIQFMQGTEGLIFQNKISNNKIALNLEALENYLNPSSVFISENEFQRNKKEISGDTSSKYSASFNNPPITDYISYDAMEHHKVYNKHLNLILILSFSIFLAVIFYFLILKKRRKIINPK